MKDFFKKLFFKHEKLNVPLVHTMLERSAQETEDLENWKRQAGPDFFKQLLNEQYHNFLLTQTSEASLVSFYDNPKSAGFVLYHQTENKKSDLKHLFDLLKEQVLFLGYRGSLSDVKEFNKKDFVEKIERHYLKPSINRDPNLKIADQKFGNINLELIYHNDKIKYLKLVCNAYSDYKFSKAKSFTELMDSLF